jgi:hypothetical protein
MKVYQCFIGPQILNFERTLSLSPDPQSSLISIGKISLGGPGKSKETGWLRIRIMSQSGATLLSADGCFNKNSTITIQLSVLV